MNSVLLDVKNLSAEFLHHHQRTEVLHSISFNIYRNEIVCLVGESGSGKSVTAKSIVRLFPEKADCILSGQIFYQGTDLLPLGEKEMLRFRGRGISMIFQDSLSAMNPVYKVKTQLRDVFFLHHGEEGGRNWKDTVLSLLHDVEIEDPEEVMEQYPFQLSGGMRQRIQIAASLIHVPSLLIADEPTTALDVLVQKQILHLLKKIRNQKGTSVFFISHDLGVVYDMADRILVMKGGQIVEQGSRDDIFFRPRHPYTRELLSSIPKIPAASGGL